MQQVEKCGEVPGIVAKEPVVTEIRGLPDQGGLARVVKVVGLPARQSVSHVVDHTLPVLPRRGPTDPSLSAASPKYIVIWSTISALVPIIDTLVVDPKAIFSGRRKGNSITVPVIVEGNDKLNRLC